MGPCVGQEKGGVIALLARLPSSCRRKIPGPLQIPEGGCSPPLGSNKEMSYCQGLEGLGWEGSPELGVEVGVEGGGVQQWGTLVPCPP